MSAALAIKLLLTPALVVGASLVARRWGPQVGGWLVGFPLTSAPVAVVLLLEHGRSFAATAALATLLGVLSQAFFGVAYTRTARRFAWPVCLAAGTVGFAAGTVALANLRLPAPFVAVFVAAGLTLALAATPLPRGRIREADLPAWDLPARVVVATAFILVVTGLAGRIGPTLTGLLTPFPLYAAVLGVFAHIHEGRASATAVMHGLLVGLYGFGSFFLVLGLLLVPFGPLVAFGAAVTAVCLVQGAALLIGRRRPRRQPAAESSPG
jgi:hypothetical protein